MGKEATGAFFTHDEFSGIGLAVVGLHHFGDGLMEVDSGGADGVHGEGQEEGRGGKDGATGGQEVGERGVDFPNFTFGAAAEFGWVEDDAIVKRAASGFALDEFEGVIDDPTDGFVLKAREQLVFMCPGDRFFGGIEMGNGGAGMGGDKGGQAGIAKQVEHLDGTIGLRDEAGIPIPMGGEFRENAEVAAWGGHGPEFNGGIGHGPFFLEGFLGGGRVGKGPMSTAFFAGGLEDGIDRAPGGLGQGAFPNSLGLRADEAVRSEAFEFEPIAAINEFIILPIR